MLHFRIYHGKYCPGIDALMSVHLQLYNYGSNFYYVSTRFDGQQEKHESTLGNNLGGRTGLGKGLVVEMGHGGWGMELGLLGGHKDDIDEIFKRHLMRQ